MLYFTYQCVKFLYMNSVLSFFFFFCFSINVLASAHCIFGQSLIHGFGQSLIHGAFSTSSCLPYRERPILIVNNSILVIILRVFYYTSADYLQLTDYSLWMIFLIIAISKCLKHLRDLCCFNRLVSCARRHCNSRSHGMQLVLHLQKR